MNLCQRCKKLKDGDIRRGMCMSCYTTFRDREVAYGRWEADRVPADESYAHAVALLDAGMRRLQILRLSDLPGSTFNRFMREKPATVSRSTADAIQSIQIPNRVTDWIAIAEGNDLVPAIGARRRMRAMVAAGHPPSALAHELNVHRPIVSALLHRGKRIRAYRHHQVVALFNRLQLIPGPSDDARAYGKAKKWSLPFQWDEDEIDEPDACTVQGARRYPRERANALAVSA
ncbi:hypothetical protein [Nocardia aurea]|uniref:hypothetical protein n=1 Tax=Nocardia aurea TaxID=2144174 RepID=UPI0033B8493C